MESNPAVEEPEDMFWCNARAGAGLRIGDDRISVFPLAGYIGLLVGVGTQTIRARRQKGWQDERDSERKEES